MEEPRQVNVTLVLLETVRDHHLRLINLEQMLRHHYDAAESHVQQQIDENVKEHAKEALLSGQRPDETLRLIDGIIAQIRRS